MKRNEKYDLTYITIDALSEGVGSSQIIPLISRLSQTGLRINLITFEKSEPSPDRISFFKSIGVEWNYREFGPSGLIGGVNRINDLRREIPRTDIIHARSDIPAVSGFLSSQAPVLWDVRSLWADQKIMIQDSPTNRALYRAYRSLESIAASKSVGMSTLTKAVLPILEERHKTLPLHRTVVPTAVDLERFKLVQKFPVNIRALFSGTFNDYYDLGLSARFMQELCKSKEVDIHWARPHESNKSFIGVGETRTFPATQNEMADLIPNYSFGISVCKMNAGPSLTAAMPTKIAEFLACGRPIVVNKGLGDMDQLLEESNAGVVLDGSPENLKEGASKLISLIEDPETPARCRNLAEKYFNMDVGSIKYLNLYKEVLEQKPKAP